VRVLGIVSKIRGKPAPIAPEVLDVVGRYTAAARTPARHRAVMAVAAGIGLAIPGVVLYSLGFAWGPRPLDPR